VQQQVSLLVGPLAAKYRRERPLFGILPGADVSAPSQTPWIQIPFRSGGFWQPSKLTFLPPAADVATPGATPLSPYTFRVFWAPTKVILFPAPADVSPPNQPIVQPYVFRNGGFWQIQKALAAATTRIDVGVADIGALDSNYVGFGALKITRRTDITFIRKRHKEPAPDSLPELAQMNLLIRIRDMRLEALWLSGAITDDEYFALRFS
jgi:hypothetical protein